MNRQRQIDLGIALLRISLGVMLIAHSIVLKLFVYSLPGTAQFFQSIGLPGPLAYVVFAVEAIAGIALVLGIGTRVAAAAVVPVLVGALWVHAGNGWVFSAANGGWEYPLYLTVLAIAQTVLGEGAYALSRRSTDTAHVGQYA
jgi:putative oxidoreductase